MTFTFTSNGQWLIVAGAALFMVGLAQGAAIPLFYNPRMALSAHLDAVQSGMALMVAGLVWGLASWSARIDRWAFGMLLAGMYGIWIAITVAAITGASRSLPIAGDGFDAVPAAEFVVTVVVTTSSVLAALGWLALTIALIRSAARAR